MSPALYSGQYKFHILDKEMKQAKQRADARRRMANLRYNKRQQQNTTSFITEEVIAQQSIEK